MYNLSEDEHKIIELLLTNVPTNINLATYLAESASIDLPNLVLKLKELDWIDFHENKKDYYQKPTGKNLKSVWLSGHSNIITSIEEFEFKLRYDKNYFKQSYVHFNNLNYYKCSKQLGFVSKLKSYCERKKDVTLECFKYFHDDLTDILNNLEVESFNLINCDINYETFNNPFVKNLTIYNPKKPDSFKFFDNCTNLIKFTYKQ
jgi:hypothetical protein